MKRMKVLILSKFFAPEQGVAAVRWTKISKYLSKDRNVEISVITEKRNFDKENDLILKSLKDDLLEKDMVYIDQCYEVPLNLGLRIYHYFRNKYQKSKVYDKTSDEVLYDKPGNAVGRVRKSLYLWIFDFNNMLWCNAVKKFVKKIDLSDYDAVISSCGPFWTHRAASFIKKEKHEIIWIADFRDSYASDLVDTRYFYRRHIRQIKRYCANADMVLRVNDTMRTDTPVNIPVETVTNGFDPEEKVIPQKPEKFNIIYTGTMYHFDNIGIVCRAVKELVQEEKIEDSVQVEFYGSGGEYAQKQANKENASKYFVNHGMVPRHEVIRERQNAAVLLQMSHNTKLFRCEWTGKMYEYMMSEKPIIYTVSGNIPNSMPSKYMKLLGGCCYETCRHKETYPILKQFIYEKYREWKESGEISLKRDDEYVAQFAYPQIAEKVYQLIEKRMRTNGDERKTFKKDSKERD